LSTDENAPVRRGEQASREHHDEEPVDPETFALQLAERVEVQQAGADVDLYLARTVERLFEMSPGLREHISDLLLADLSEELYRRGWPGRNAARMVAEVQRDWTQEA
jgi:hypothetical protein